MEKDFIRYLRIKEILTGKKIIQDGGVIESVRIGVHNIEYDINSFGNSTTELYALATKKGNDKQPCFAMHIIPGADSILLTLNRGNNCFEDEHDQSSDIVLAGLEIAKLKGAKTFEFTDNSSIRIEGKKISLADLLFLTTGKTWYERILPIKPSTEESIKDVEIWRKKNKSNSWKYIYNNLLKLKIDADLDTTGIDINKAGSAMKVLERAKKSKIYHNFFYECMKQLLIASLFPDLKEDAWDTQLDLIESHKAKLHGITWKMYI